MAVGCSPANASSEHNENGSTTPRQMVQKPPFHVPRPLSSPRMPPRKRQLEPELEAVDLAFDLNCQVSECSQPLKKQPKLELSRNVQILDEILPRTPERKTAKVAEVTPQKLPSLRGPRQNQKLEEAVKVAMDCYKAALTDYALEKDRVGEEEADKFAEKWAADHYEELKNAILGLLPWTGEMEEAKGDLAYDLIKFQGRKTTRMEVNKTQLRHFRSEGAQCRAWEALCAVLSAISSREEKVWLEYHDLQDDLDEILKDKKGCKSKTSPKREAVIREAIPNLVEQGAGGFAVSLIDPRGVHAVSFARGPEGPLPATSMHTRRMPLWDALKSMDDDGPLRSDAMDKSWAFKPGTEFCLQDLVFGQPLNSRKDRKNAKELVADKAIRDLLLSKKPVVVLDTLAALAPRDVAKANGLSKIVTAELHTLLREAKARGEAVVFSLGTDVPHKLAEKVYLRNPLGNYGMRCGPLRWRESAEVPWAREFRWEDRITLCLQMP